MVHISRSGDEIIDLSWKKDSTHLTSLSEQVKQILELLRHIKVLFTYSYIIIKDIIIVIIISEILS